FKAGNSIDIYADINLGSGDLIFNAGVISCGSVSCAGVGSKNFLLDESISLNTLGNISIKAADNEFITGSIGNSIVSESVVIKAGNDITLTSTSSITAGLNSDTASHTIHLSAGDSTLFSSGEIAERSVPLTGNLDISGRLTTEGGSIYLTANGGVDTSTT